MAAVQNTPVPAHELVYEPQQLPRLCSNQGAHLDEDTVGWMRPTPISTPLPEMRRRFATEGYLFIKNLLPRSDVLDLREAYFSHLSPTNLLAPNTSPRLGIFNPNASPTDHNGNGGTDLPSENQQLQLLSSVHTHPTYLTFLNHPDLHTFVQTFTGWSKPPLITKRTLLRHNVPQGLSTGIHYDKIFLRAGEADFLTAWVPLGDISPSSGGLMYLSNSTDIGLAMEKDFNERAKDFTAEERINAFNVNMAKDGQLSHDAVELTEEIESGVGKGEKRKGLVGDYEAGDVVFHNPYMIHGAVKNEDPKGRIRLSTDLRFYEEGSELDKRWMAGVWRPDDGL